MKKRRLVAWCCLAVAAPALCQQTTLARLSRTDLPHVSDHHVTTSKTYLRDSAISRAAAAAFFVKSDFVRAGRLADRALRRDHNDVEALFVRMELAAIAADDGATLDAALRLCEAGASAPGDVRVRLAAVRVRELAANTADFRAILPQVEALVTNSTEPLPDLQAALLNAALDGTPGLDAAALARDAGILTDWRIVGPLGSRPLLDLDRQFIAPSDDLALSSYQNHPVENFQFIDGWIRLPDYFSRHGVFYAAGRFASLTNATWKLQVASGGRLEVYVDGQRVLRTGGSSRLYTARFQAPAGPHGVLVKFAGSAAPLRVAVTRYSDPERSPLRANLSLEEAAYLLAAEHYVDGEAAAAIRQLQAVGVADESAALQFLLAESFALYAQPTLTKAPAAGDSGGSQNAERAWYQLQENFPKALAADVALGKLALAKGDFAAAEKYAGRVLAQDENDAAALQVMSEAELPDRADNPAGLWVRRLAVDPSCEALQQAVVFYAAQALPAERSAAQQKLDGCAPESLAYAQSLAQDGNHAAAAQALERLLAAAPLDRAARLMLVRELQLSGEDGAAQRAATEWLRIAPNAESYHRLAASAETTEEQGDTSMAAFYEPYRRDAALIARETAAGAQGPPVVLLDDHIALARADGSVSLYVHVAKRLLVAQSIAPTDLAKVPRGAQVLQMRVIHADGTTSPITPPQTSPSTRLSPGDTMDAEYVLNFAGDGGISEHDEIFQFVFGSFNEKVLHTRFVVLTPAEHADRGVVLSTGTVPRMRTSVRDGMLARTWQEDATAGVSSANPGGGSAIIRVVDQEHGWAVPTKAEHQRRIETIHPGPRPEDS